MSNLSIKQMPENWAREIEAGTAFGKKAEAAWKTIASASIIPAVPIEDRSMRGQAKPRGKCCKSKEA